jgi:glycosyltransferase involved in cell wall biosynthesis
MPLNLHFVGLATVPAPGSMGGNTRIFLEFARQLQAWPGLRLTVYVSEAARATCRAAGLDDRTTIRTSPKRIDDRFYWPAAHLSASRSGLRTITSVCRQPGDGPHVIYSGSDFWPDVAVGRRLARQLQGLWVASVFLFVPHPLRGYLGEFTGRRHVPDPLATLGWLYQQATLPLIRRGADMVFVTNDVDRPRLRGARAYPDRIHAIYGGVDLAEAEAARPDPCAQYDAAFVGRLHPMKGIAQLLDVWAHVVRERPEARLALIGVGRPGYTQQMRARCTQLGLDHAVDWLGYRDGPAKYALLKRARIFLHTSIFDNNGMAACEAMAVGVPAVLFDLPPLRVAYPTGALRAPLGDTRAFAEQALRLLSDDALHARLAAEARALAASWSWDARVKAALVQIDATLRVERRR